MDYHPAFQDALFNPLFDLEKKEQTSLLPTGVQAAPPAVLQKFKALRRSVRAAYVAQTRRRVEAILDACRNWGVEVVVFPEYSIPPELLEPIAERAGKMVVVAGSHYVEREVLQKKLYQRLGLDAAAVPKLEQSVSAVLHDGKLLSLVSKLHPAKPELPAMRPGDEWSPVALPAGMPGPMGVLICLDFLVRSGPQHLEFVARDLGDCRFLAAPALTPTLSLSEFNAQALKDARRDHRPVLLANLARHGGSTIVVDEGRETDLSLFPEHAGRLEAGEEGVIVADIDLGFDRSGSSTPYLLTRSIVPFAAASLVYSGVDREYAAWCREVQAKLDDASADEVEKLQSIEAIVARRPPPIADGASARKRRLERLAQDIETESSVTRVRQLTTELVLPEDVLPLSILRAALARGAADEVERWVTELKAGEFGPVTSRLRAVWEKAERGLSSWSPTTQRVVGEVSTVVRGGPKPADPKAVVAFVEVLEEEVERGFEAENKRASEHFEQGHYAEARDAYREMLKRATDLSVHGEAAERPSMRRWAMRCRLNVALATLNLQEIDEARELLLVVEPQDIPARAQLMFVEALALVGEREKAQAILPKEEELAEADRERFVEVWQTLELLDGRLPDPLADSAPIYLRAASMLLARDDFGAAAERALGALARSKGNVLTIVFALEMLTYALRGTVFEVPTSATRIPVEQRGPIIEALETYFATLRGRHDLSAYVREGVKKIELLFRGLIRDLDAFSAVTDEGTAANGERADDPRQIALRFALDGRVEEALRALPPDPDNHPWRGRLDRAEMLALGKQFDRALEEALALAREFSERAPIEHLTAELCAMQGRAEEALRHAELAYKQLPGKGYRLLLARQRLVNGQAEEAWDLVKDLSDDQPRVLQTRALAAEEAGRLEDAEKAWARYVERRPQDGPARVRFAQLLFRLHRPEQAAAIAWTVFAEQGDRLDLEALYVCGSLQRLAGPLDAEQRRRILEVAARIKERFHGNAEAEHYRLQIVMMLGELPAEAGRIDFEGLADKGYVIRGEGISELKEFVEHRHAFLDEVTRFARLGAIPTSTACAISNTPLALVVTRILERSRHANGLLCPPVSVDDQPVTFEIEGATLLVSDLELLLLEVLDLLPVLRRALGSNGQLVLFRRAYDRIHRDFASLRIAANLKKLAETEALLRQLERLPALEADPSAPLDDIAAARKAGAAIVSEKAADVPHISPRAFLRHLSEQGCLDDEQCARIERSLPAEPDPRPSTNPLPDRVVLTWSLVEDLFQNDALMAVFEANPRRLVLGPRVKPHFQYERDDLADTIRAEELAGKVQKRLSEGWVQEVPEPPVTDLPPVRDGANRWGREFVLKPLQEMLTYRYAVLEHPEWWRLSAELYGSNSLGAPEFTAMLAWANEEAYLNVAERLRKAVRRDLTFPALVRALTRDRKELDRLLLKLAELGFPDALGADEILRLERRYKGLEKAEPRRILDNQEWMSKAPEHLGGDHARLRLAKSYAATIFQAFLSTERSPAERKALVDTLLDRQEFIGKAGVTNALDQTLAFIASRTVDRGQMAWRPEGENYVIDPEGPIASLWSTLSSWSGSDGSRRAAHGRAVREVWRTLNRLPGGPPKAVAAALELAHFTPPGEATDLSFLEPETEAVTILSALWKESPFGSADYDALFAHGVDLLASNLTQVRNPREAGFRVFIGEEASPVLARVPLEALLLRAPSSVRQEAAKHLKAIQGPYDGISYGLLDRIERAPDDTELLLDFAEHAAAALFRLVQDDPPFLRLWGQSRRFVVPATQRRLEELLDVLSEPHEPLPDKRLSDILLRRWKEGSWAGRADRDSLFALSLEVPGELPGGAWLGRFYDEVYEGHVRLGLDRLDHPEEHPIARVAGDVIFLRIAAAQRPLVKLPEGEVDLREILPGRLERLLEKVMAPSEPDTLEATKSGPDTLGAAEAPLLRICGEVVQRLAQPNVLPLRQGLWFTYRLFQWLCLQLDAISPDARRDGIRRLVAQAMPPGESRDVLDPFGFDRDRFDHRLAALLHALGDMEPLVKVARRQQPVEGAPPPRSVSSPALEDKLLQLARRAHQGPRLPSKLAWNAPDNVPDLALSVLLRLNNGRFADLGPEARTRRFEALPDDPQATEETDHVAFAFASEVLHAAANTAASLSAAERALLEAKLRAMADGAKAREWRWIVFTSLSAKAGEHLEEEAQRLTIEHVGHNLAPVLFGQLLLGVAERDPKRIEQITENVLAAALRQGAGAAGLAVGALGRLLVHGVPAAKETARDLILKLAERPPFRDDPRVSELIGFFGLREQHS